MTEELRWKAMRNGDLADYYSAEMKQEIDPIAYRVGKMKLLNKEKHELLDQKYDLMLKVKAIDVKLSSINSQMDNLKNN